MDVYTLSLHGGVTKRDVPVIQVGSTPKYNKFGILPTTSVTSYTGVGGLFHEGGSNKISSFTPTSTVLISKKTGKLRGGSGFLSSTPISNPHNAEFSWSGNYD